MGIKAPYPPKGPYRSFKGTLKGTLVTSYKCPHGFRMASEQPLQRRGSIGAQHTGGSERPGGGRVLVGFFNMGVSEKEPECRSRFQREREREHTHTCIHLYIYIYLYKLIHTHIYIYDYM